MGAVFDAQFRILQDAFAGDGIRVEIAYTPDGTVEYLYQKDRLLTWNPPGDAMADRTDARRHILEDVLPGVRLLSPEGEPDADEALHADGERETGLAVLSLDSLRDGPLTVPQALAVIADELGDDAMGGGDNGPLFTPNHVVHICRICPACEPEVPVAAADGPWPAARPPFAQAGRDGARIAVCDTGLLQGLDGERYPWLDGVTGDVDALVMPATHGPAQIERYTGHGTFVAGVARCLAPTSTVVVSDHFTDSGGVLEDQMVARLDEIATAENPPDIINLSAGTYTRANWRSAGFESFHHAHPDITLVTAAGNETTDRPFWPAAYDWCIAVGALGADQAHRAWFSNYGDWVDVYAPGEGLVNAYATGEYTYQEPPKRPSTQTFDGMARWDGTSFAAPVVAGLIAERMVRRGESSAEAARGVLDAATQVKGLGRVLAADAEPW